MAVQAKARPSELHERDLHAWSEVQADLLRGRRFSELDLVFSLRPPTRAPWPCPMQEASAQLDAR
jgi:hypothetical protein